MLPSVESVYPKTTMAFSPDVSDAAWHTRMEPAHTVSGFSMNSSLASNGAEYVVKL